jgi:anti-anti-sigma factor
MTAPDTAASTVRPGGELTIQTAAERHATLLEALEGTTELTVDLSRVSEFDTAGLQVLLALVAEGERRGHPVRIVSPAPVVREVLALCRLGDDLRRLPIDQGRAA